MDSKTFQTHRYIHNRQNSWWLNDAKGIPLTRVCDDCAHYVVTEHYPPEVTGRYGKYEDVVEEPVDND